MSVPDKSIDPRLLQSAKEVFLDKGFEMAQFTFDKTQQEMHCEAISEMDVSAAHERKHKKPVWLIAGAAVLCLLLGLMIAE